MSEWQDIVKNSYNPKVLLMLSGGKDSIAAMIKMVEFGIDVDAIHFWHEWSECIPFEEAKRLCEEYSVKLIKYNFSDAFKEAVNGYKNGRPCLLCKRRMYECLEAHLKDNDYGWLAIGDTASDETTIARMKKFDNPFGNTQLECSDYFGSEMGCKLPKGMHVLRPLIRLKSTMVEEYLDTKGLSIKRIQSTGDKYFEYHREGCPIQFADVGACIDEKLMQDLYIYNSRITEFARKKNIRASIHMPSTFIITIPKGYENEAANYLQENGLSTKHDANTDVIEPEIIYGYAELINGDYFADESYKKCFERFCERLGIESDFDVTFNIDENMFLCKAKAKDYVITMIFQRDISNAQISILMKKPNICNIAKIENLIVEIFRTRKNVVQIIKKREGC